MVGQVIIGRATLRVDKTQEKLELETMNGPKGRGLATFSLPR
jgi:hypothetical protein